MNFFLKRPDRISPRILAAQIAKITMVMTIARRSTQTFICAIIAKTSLPPSHVTRVTKDCNYVSIYYLMHVPPVNENGFALRKSEAQ